MHTATVVPSLTKADARSKALADRKVYARSLNFDLRSALETQLMQRVLPHIGAASAIGTYHPMKDEIDPTPIADALAAAGHVVALPWFAARDAAMMFRAAPAEQLELRPGPWGVLQPGADAAAVAPEIVLVPLVAADAACNRIGHGKGHYDRALAHLRQSGAVRTIGLAWDMQILDGMIDADPWDVPLDAIATPDRWFVK